MMQQSRSLKEKAAPQAGSSYFCTCCEVAAGWAGCDRDGRPVLALSGLRADTSPISQMFRRCTLDVSSWDGFYCTYVEVNKDLKYSFFVRLDMCDDSERSPDRLSLGHPFKLYSAHNKLLFLYHLLYKQQSPNCFTATTVTIKALSASH